ncbi:MAG: hypothetical protein J7647_30995 [Cyanobacteria bacterium SBLK]|nr:hypothetical protein [Cyanobacteria bacterium SBLK]
MDNKKLTLEDRVTVLEQELNRIKEIFTSSPITQTQAAKYLGRSPSFVSKRRSRPEYQSAFTATGAVWLEKFHQLLTVHG